MKIHQKILRKLNLIRRPRPVPITRHDLKEITVSSELVLLVYWKKIKLGMGPTVLLKVRGREIAKFDCFGKEKGHYHVAPDYGFRIEFTEQTVLEQVDRSFRELKENTHSYLQLQPEKEIRELMIDQDIYEEKLNEARNQMLDFVKNVEELKAVS